MQPTRALVVPHTGGSSVLTVTEVEVASPADLTEGQVLVRVAAAGVNFIDVYQRTGVYPMPLPFVSGNEAAGVVEAVGPGTDFAPGDRVAWAAGAGSCADLVVRDTDTLVPVPEGIDLEVAAAVMLQGSTAHYLTHSTYPLRAGETALVHAAAGGVGQLLVQMCVALGASVIATAGSPDKCEIAVQRGASVAINYREFLDGSGSGSQALADEVRAANGGDGVHVVYDGVGAATFDASLASLRPRGMLAVFGASSGQVPPFDLQRLNRAGSLFVTRPTLGDYVATASELRARARDLFEAILAGALHVEIGGRYPLEHAARAYDDLESRATQGKLILTL